jgi:hypothetical protein
MTQEEFDKLPLVLTSGMVREILGVDYHHVTDLAESQPKLVMKGSMQKGKHLRFYKSEIAKLAKLKY